MATRSTNKSRRSGNSGKKAKKSYASRNNTKAAIPSEVLLIIILGIAILLFLSLCGILGKFGTVVSGVLKGLFGMVSFLIPFAFLFDASFCVLNKWRSLAKIKVIATCGLIFVFSCAAQLIFANNANSGGKLIEFYTSEFKNGGLIGGVCSCFLCKYLTAAGTWVILAVILIISLMVLIERSGFSSMKAGGKNLYDDAKRFKEYRMREKEIRQDEWQEYNELKEEKKLRKEALRQEKLLRQDEKREESLRLRREKLDEKRDLRKQEAFKRMEAGKAIAMTTLTQPMPDQDEINEQIDTYDNVDAYTKDDFIENDILSNDEYSDEYYEDYSEEYENEYADESSTQVRRLESLFYGSSSSIRKMGRGREENNDNYIVSPVINLSGDAYSKDATGSVDNSIIGRAGEMTEITGAYAGKYIEVGNKSIRSGHLIEANQDEDVYSEEYQDAYERDEYIDETDSFNDDYSDVSDIHHETLFDEDKKHISKSSSSMDKRDEIRGKASSQKKEPRYKLPPISLLNEIKKSSKNSDTYELKETAEKLRQTLKNFGIDVKITGSSRGPAVTRYEIEPPVGVKVSKIVSLSDDIKLSLAATDIRMEAPIPGRSAIGIEIPNKENTAVPFRELVESRIFRDAKSKISFGVGKDLTGQSVVTDIAKMPHLLIAGATGSGKSVCINTLIMSILYKAKPDEVKLIMIDPKVVELSVYNGIPHLMIPVVTDAKKANAALLWAVNEMMRRYEEFANLSVRNMTDYNKKLMEDSELSEDGHKKMPQIVIVVDELADLMMVAAKEVEESICRLAQLARAAGIHLILATQRPSVNVITGLIKANMPSRIAFSVTSGIDSRTVLDQVGAEKLLGKGDMLFYPQGYTKPARVQGAFVSDDEVSRVVDFWKKQAEGYDTTDSEAMKAIENAENTSSQSDGVGFVSTDNDGLDDLFYEAGKTVIESGKASIGFLQRKHKIGFNRAARIMDQLSDAGVVSGEEGTKARNILMSLEEFNSIIKEKNHS